MKINLMVNYGKNGLFFAVGAINKPTGLVLVGTVRNETLKDGENVSFSYGGQESLSDQITRIEKDKQKINNADPGEKIGICLKNTSKQNLIQYLGLRIK